MVGDWVGRFVYPHVGVVTAVDALVFDLIGPIHPEAFDEGAIYCLNALEGPNTIICWDGVVREVDISLSPYLVAEQDVVGVLQVIGNEIFVVLVDDGVYIKIGKVELIAVIEEELSDVFGSGACDLWRVDALFDPKDVLSRGRWGVLSSEVETKTYLWTEPVADPQVLEVCDYFRKLSPVLPRALGERDRSYAHDLPAHTHNLIESVVEVADWGW